MTIPAGFVQITHLLDGTATPHGGAIVYGVAWDGEMEAEEIATACCAAFNGSAAASLTNGLASTTTRVKFGPDSTGAMVDVPVGIAGTSASPSAPPNVAALVRKNTALGGRHGRGRVYIPGVAESDVNNSGLMSGGSFDAFADRVEGWYAALILAGVPMALLHADATAPTAVTGLALQARVATQRRRLRR